MLNACISIVDTLNDLVFMHKLNMKCKLLLWVLEELRTDTCTHVRALACQVAFVVEDPLSLTGMA